MNRATFALDFEGYYSDDYGITTLGVSGYLNDARFDPYMISIHGGPDINGDQLVWVGPPKEAPWHLLPGDWAALAHNAAFDSLVYKRCQEMGLIPHTTVPAEWFCTADMSVFLGGPRNLKDASKVLLGIEANKEMRNYMKGKTWAEAVAEGKGQALMDYAAKDAELCYALWMKYEAQWPEIERRASALTREQVNRGIGVDCPQLIAGLKLVEAARTKAREGIPWAGLLDAKGKELKPTGALAFKAWCKDNSLPVPVTTEARSPDFKKWQSEHPEVTCVKAMQDYRSSNAWLLKGRTLLARSPDGIFNFEMKYFGATTGRWSAGYEDDRGDSTGFNIQNLYKGEHFGLDMRRCLIAPPGKKFVILDYSQIEPRVLAWLTDNKDILSALRTGMGFYEAHARATMGWTGGSLKKEGGKRYDLAKARVIALGYGTGWAKLIFMCEMFGIPKSVFHDPITSRELAEFKKYVAWCMKGPGKVNPTAEFKTELDWTEAVNAWKTVVDFRATNEGITDFWKFLETDCKRANNGIWNLALPSGRVMHYHDIKLIGGLTGRKTIAGPRLKLWGGFLTENCIQATARDIMLDGILRAEAAGFESLFTVHDEILFCVDKSVNPEDLRKLLIEAPAWASDLPLDVSCEEADYYAK